jgi:hypothetical protein
MTRLGRRRSMPGAEGSAGRFRNMFQKAKQRAAEDLNHRKEDPPDNSASILVRTATLTAWVRERQPDWGGSA